MLVEALARIRDLDWHLLCVGSLERDPPTAQMIRRMISAAGLERRITLAGEWPPQSVTHAYRTADAFVLPSFHEGYGMVFAEAMAHGLPLIATTAGAIPETVSLEAALLVPPGDSAASGLGSSPGDRRAWLAARLAADLARRALACPNGRRRRKSGKWRLIALRPSIRPRDCESAPKQDPTSHRPRLLGKSKEMLVRVGSRSAPIGTLHVCCCCRRFHWLAAVLAGGPASVLIYSFLRTTARPAELPSAGSI